MALGARAQAPSDQIVTRVSAEIMTHPKEMGPSPSGDSPPGVGQGSAAQLKPAERVVPGDVLIYTVEVRNPGRYAVESAVVVQSIPNHMMYLADSAVGPGVDVDYSVDGGRTFDTPENLKAARSGPTHARATAADYTHIRWRLHNRLKPSSIAYVRFRAQVK